MKRAFRAPVEPVTLMDHVRELRTRFFAVAIIFIASSSLAYTFRDQLIHLLLAPLDGQKLVYLNPAGGFSFIFLVSLYVGLAFTAPLLIQQIYSFIKPALPKTAQKYSSVIFLSSFTLLVAGIVFGYLFAIPGALHFLYGFATEYIEASLTADSYLNFIIAYTIGIGIVFQLPLVLLLIHWIRPFTPGGLMRTERWVIVFAFIVAALITPTPDPINQTIIALPIIIVYQIGVVAILISIQRARRAHNRTVTITPKHTVPPQTMPIRPPSTAPTPKIAPTTPVMRRSLDGVIAPTTRLHPIAKTNTTSKITPSHTSSRHGSPHFSMDGVSRRIISAS